MRRVPYLTLMSPSFVGVTTLFSVFLSSGVIQGNTKEMLLSISPTGTKEPGPVNVATVLWSFDGSFHGRRHAFTEHSGLCSVPC